MLFNVKDFEKTEPDSGPQTQHLKIVATFGALPWPRLRVGHRRKNRRISGDGRC